MSLRFRDKVAIVTGGCSGIGKGCAEVLVEQGGIVVILDKVADETSPTIPGPGKVKYMKCDVTNEDEVKSCIEQTVTEFGKIDCLVNNAGVHTGVVTIDTISVDDFKTLFDINVISMFIMSKYTLPYLRKTKGSIVNISSFSGEAGQTGCSTYCATKGAVTSFAKGLAADEAKNGVRVNTICPGPTNTPLLKGVIGDTSTKSDIVYNMLLGRFGEPREIGLACLYLAVDATFSTGATLMCTGGAEIGYGLKYRQELLLPERTDGNQ